MKQNEIFGGVIFIVFLLISSSGFAAPQIKENDAGAKSFLSTSENMDQGSLLKEDEQLDVSSLLQELFFRADASSLLDLFTGIIRTNCAGVEKTSEITFALYNDIDVDNDENTGVNGKDIRVQYLILPYFLPSPDLTIGAMLSVNVDRIGDEIKDKAFSLSVEIADKTLAVGYQSPDQQSNEIPESIQLSTTVFLKLTDNSIGFSFHMNPSYVNNQDGKKITLFGSVEHSAVTHGFSFNFEPSTETDIIITSTKKPNEWQYKFSKDAAFETRFIAELSKSTEGETKETTLTINPLPDQILFSLSLTPFSSEGGSISYQCDQMHDISVLVETSTLGICKYALIKNTPRRIDAEWLPAKQNGFYHINIDSDGTQISLLNTLTNPTINLSITDLSTVDMTAFWNLTKPGDFEVIKDPSFHIDLDFVFEEWVMNLDAEPTAEKISFSWDTNNSGFIAMDTDWQPLNQMELHMVGPDLGVNIAGETLKAEDFQLNWTETIFPVEITGELDFFSISIHVLIDGTWYKLWPLL